MIYITLLSAIPVVNNVTRDCEFNFSGELLVHMKYNLSSESAQMHDVAFLDTGRCAACFPKPFPYL